MNHIGGYAALAAFLVMVVAPLAGAHLRGGDVRAKAPASVAAPARTPAAAMPAAARPDSVVAIRVIAPATATRSISH